MKRLGSFLLAICLAMSFTIAASATVFGVETKNGSVEVDGDVRDDMASAMFDLMNRERAKVGSPELSWDSSLEKAAIQRAAELSVSFSHYRPDGSLWSTVSDLLPINGAENIAYGQESASAAMNDLMKSAGHRESILNAKCVKAAVGCVEVDGKPYWVQLFIKEPSSSSSGGSTSSTNNYLKYTVKFITNGAPAIEDQLVTEGDKIARPTNPRRDSFIFNGWYTSPKYETAWNFSKDSVTSDMTLYAKWRYRSVSQSSTSSSGNGSGSVSSGDTSAPAGEITLEKLRDAAEKALSSASKTAAIRAVNPGSISPDTLKSLSSLAAQKGKTLFLYADTMETDGKTMQGRMYVNTSAVTGLSSNLKLGVYTESAKTASVKSRFESWFRGCKIAVVHFEQQGSLGARMEIAVKLDIRNMDGGNLLFYAYDKTKNNYSLLKDTSYFTDKDGYLHFYTSVGGDIVITDKKLGN